MCESEAYFLHSWSPHSPVAAVVHIRYPQCQETVLCQSHSVAPMSEEQSLHSDCVPLDTCPGGHHLELSQVNSGGSTQCSYCRLLPLASQHRPRSLRPGAHSYWRRIAGLGPKQDSAIHRVTHHPFTHFPVLTPQLWALFPCDPTSSLTTELYFMSSWAVDLLNASGNNRTPTTQKVLTGLWD